MTARHKSESIAELSRLNSGHAQLAQRNPSARNQAQDSKDQQEKVLKHKEVPQEALPERALPFALSVGLERAGTLLTVGRRSQACKLMLRMRAKASRRLVGIWVVSADLAAIVFPIIMLLIAVIIVFCVAPKGAKLNDCWKNDGQTT